MAVLDSSSFVPACSTRRSVTTARKLRENPLLGENQQHWGIENRNHYVRDVSFDEDKSPVLCINRHPCSVRM